MKLFFFYCVLHIPLDKFSTLKVKDNANVYKMPGLTNKAFQHNKPFYKIADTELVKGTIRILTSQDSFVKDDIFTLQQLIGKHSKRSPDSKSP